MKTALILMSAALLGAGAANAAEFDTGSAVSERVSIGDLDLTSPTGLARLDERIRGAADRVCSVGELTNLQARNRYQRCFETAVRDANRQRDRILSARRMPPAFRTAALATSGR